MCLPKAFSRAFHDALFVIHNDNKRLVKAVLEKNRTTWEEKLAKNPDWVFYKVERRANIKIIFYIISELIMPHIK